MWEITHAHRHTWRCRGGKGRVWGITERSIHTHTHTHTRLTQTNTGNEGREGVENQTYTYILSDTQGGIKGQGGWKGPTCTSPDTPGGWMGGRGVGEVKHTATRRLWQPTHTYTLTDNGEGGKEEETKETH